MLHCRRYIYCFLISYLYHILLYRVQKRINKSKYNVARMSPTCRQLVATGWRHEVMSPRKNEKKKCRRQFGDKKATKCRQLVATL